MVLFFICFNIPSHCLFILHFNSLSMVKTDFYSTMSTYSESSDSKSHKPNYECSVFSCESCTSPYLLHFICLWFIRIQNWHDPNPNGRERSIQSLRTSLVRFHEKRPVSWSVDGWKQTSLRSPDVATVWFRWPRDGPPSWQVRLSSWYNGVVTDARVVHTLLNVVVTGHAISVELCKHEGVLLHCLSPLWRSSSRQTRVGSIGERSLSSAIIM